MGKFKDLMIDDLFTEEPKKSITTYCLSMMRTIIKSFNQTGRYNSEGTVYTIDGMKTIVTDLADGKKYVVRITPL